MPIVSNNKWKWMCNARGTWTCYELVENDNWLFMSHTYYQCFDNKLHTHTDQPYHSTLTCMATYSQEDVGVTGTGATMLGGNVLLANEDTGHYYCAVSTLIDYLGNLEVRLQSIG